MRHKDDEHFKNMGSEPGKKVITVAKIMYLFPPSFSGGARHAIELAKGLRQFGIECFFVGANLEGAAEFEIFEGFPVYRINTSEGKRIAYLKYALKVCKILFNKRGSYHLIHVHTLRPFFFMISLLGKFIKMPVVFSPTLVGTDDPTGLKRKSFMFKVEGKTLRFFDKIICKSTALKKSFIKAKIPQAKISHIPGAIPCGEKHSHFRPVLSPVEIGELRKNLNLPLNSFIVAFVGRLQTRKGCDHLFDAWDELLKTNDFFGHLLLIGPYSVNNNPLSEEEKKFNIKLKLFLENHHDKRVIFVGKLDYADVPKYLRASDCFVFPSKREGLPKAVIEAMASGLPVICTDIPDITSDLIENGENGIVLYDDHPNSLAGKILKVRDDEQFRKKLSYNALMKIKKKFSINRIVGLHSEIYNSLIK